MCIYIYIYCMYCLMSTSIHTLVLGHRALALVHLDEHAWLAVRVGRKVLGLIIIIIISIIYIYIYIHIYIHYNSNSNSNSNNNSNSNSGSGNNNTNTTTTTTTNNNNNATFFVGIVVLRSISFVITPPAVSRPLLYHIILCYIISYHNMCLY